MRYLPLLIAITISLASLSVSAGGMDFSFVGRKPDFAGAKRMQVEKDVNPGIPLIFDTGTPGIVILRPASSNENSNSDRTTYRFERDQNGDIVFYEIADEKKLQALEYQNSIDTASPDGKAIEKSIFETFIASGKILRDCIPKKGNVPEKLTFFIITSASGTLDKSIVQPEGAISQCILEAAPQSGYVSNKHFVSKVSINITP